MQLKKILIDHTPKLSTRQAKRRYRLWLENPNCFWCGIPTVWLKECPKPAQDNFATLDHLVSRFDERRKEQGFKNKTVLSCYKCNHDRGRIDDMLVPLYEKWERAKRYGQPIIVVHPLNYTLEEKYAQ